MVLDTFLYSEDINHVRFNDYVGECALLIFSKHEFFNLSFTFISIKKIRIEPGFRIVCFPY